MAETHVQAQVRLLLEAQCARAFNALVKKFHPKCELTLIAFDYTEGETVDQFEYSNVAFKTSLDGVSLVELLEARIARWREPNPPTLPHDRARQGWLPDESDLVRYARFMRDHLPKSLGFSLFCGRGQRSQYIGAGDREGCAKMFEDDLLPGLRGEVRRG